MYFIISLSLKLLKKSLLKEKKNFTFINCSPKKNKTTGTIEPILMTSKNTVKNVKKNNIKKLFFCSKFNNGIRLKISLI